MAITTKKVNQLDSVGTIATGDTLVGERVNGTTVRMTFTGIPLIDGDKGDITVSSSGTVWTVDNDAITYAKMQNVSATDTLLGRSTSGAGDVEEITCTAAGRALLDDAAASDQRTTLGLGTLATQSGTFSGTHSGTSSGTNTGDQTSIVGISGTKAEFDTAVSDGNILYVGDIVGVTDGDKGEVVVSSSGATWTLDDNLTLHGTSGVTIPQGSTAGRPAASTFGKLRGNTTSGEFEFDNGATWNLIPRAPETVTNNAVFKADNANSGLLAATSVIINDNNNLAANNLIPGYTSTATAAGTTTLTIASTNTQIFTGSTTQTVVLPVVSTLTLGTPYKIVNLSSGVVTVQSSGANAIQAMQANSTLEVVSNATTGTDATVWHVEEYVPAASSQTGSGSLVRATSPVLVTPALGTVASGVISACTSTSMVMVTPTLGAANATSINFGQDALNYYDEGTWTPAITFATPGDLSPSYVTQTGTYTRLGRLVTIRADLRFTPTYTTASGLFSITGLPFTISGTTMGTPLHHEVNLDYPAGTTTASTYFLNSGTSIFISNVGNGAASAFSSVTEVKTAEEQIFKITGYYFV